MTKYAWLDEPLLTTKSCQASNWQPWLLRGLLVGAGFALGWFVGLMANDYAAWNQREDVKLGVASLTQATSRFSADVDMLRHDLLRQADQRDAALGKRLEDQWALIETMFQIQRPEVLDRWRLEQRLRKLEAK